MEPVADLKASNRVIGVGGHEMKPRSPDLDRAAPDSAGRLVSFDPGFELEFQIRISSPDRAAALLADEDVDDGSTKRRSSTFLNVVVLGNVVSALRHSLQDRLSKGSGRSRADEINLKLRTSTGLRIYFPSVVILIRTMQKKGPRSAADIPWVALIGQSVSIASAQSGGVGSESSLETAWRAETESLKTILIGAPQNKLGRVALVDTLAKQIRARIKLRLPNILSGLQGKSQIVQDELSRLGAQMVQSAEGTRAIALQLCREFEDKFLEHIALGEVSNYDLQLLIYF
ncbi:hypothetical protein GW17_00022526 [Ensete ventricosum]|nr:hypothetical protein GW17_00022526 [Ensete ventricosum]